MVQVKCWNRQWRSNDSIHGAISKTPPAKLLFHDNVEGLMCATCAWHDNHSFSYTLRRKITRARTPVKLLGASKKMTRSEALKLEYRTKKPYPRKNSPNSRIQMSKCCARFEKNFIAPNATSSAWPVLWGLHQPTLPSPAAPGQGRRGALVVTLKMVVDPGRRLIQLPHARRHATA